MTCPAEWGRIFPCPAVPSLWIMVYLARNGAATPARQRLDEFYELIRMKLERPAPAVTLSPSPSRATGLPRVLRGLTPL